MVLLILTDEGRIFSPFGLQITFALLYVAQFFTYFPLASLCYACAGL